MRHFRYNTNQRARLVISCLIFGLVSQGGIAGKAVAQDNDSRLQKEASDYQRTVFEGAGLGGLTGCAMGAAAGFLGGGSQGVVRGCIGGGIFGTISGLVNGENVARQKQAFAGQEDNLKGRIAVLRQQNKELGSIAATADRLVAQRRAELAELNAGGTSDGSGKRVLKARLDHEIEILDAVLAKSRDEWQLTRAALNAYRGAERPDAAANIAAAGLKSAGKIEVDRRALNGIRSAL